MIVENMPILNEAKNDVEIVVHVSENLEGRQRNNLVVALKKEDGIVAAEFCPLRNHLMLVRYDRGPVFITRRTGRGQCSEASS